MGIGSKCVHVGSLRKMHSVIVNSQSGPKHESVTNTKFDKSTAMQL